MRRLGLGVPEWCAGGNPQASAGSLQAIKYGLRFRTRCEAKYLRDIDSCGANGCKIVSVGVTTAVPTTDAIPAGGIPIRETADEPVEPKGSDSSPDRATSEQVEGRKTRPLAETGRVNRAFSYRSKGDFERFVADFSEAIRLDPNAAILYYQRGLTFSEQEKYDLARADFKEALRLNPSLSDAKERLEKLQLLAESAPEEQGSVDDSGDEVCLSGKGDLDNLLTACGRLLKDKALNGADRAEAHSIIGAVYMRKGEHEAAIASLDEAIRLRPNATDFNNRGIAHSRKGDYDGAIADYDEALRLETDAVTLFNRASAIGAREISSALLPISAKQSVWTQPSPGRFTSAA